MTDNLLPPVRLRLLLFRIGAASLASPEFVLRRPTDLARPRKSRRLSQRRQVVCRTGNPRLACVVTAVTRKGTLLRSALSAIVK